MVFRSCVIMKGLLRCWWLFCLRLRWQYYPSIATYWLGNRSVASEVPLLSTGRRLFLLNIYILGETICRWSLWWLLDRLHRCQDIQSGTKTCNNHRKQLRCARCCSRKNSNNKSLFFSPSSLPHQHTHSGTTQSKSYNASLFCSFITANSLSFLIVLLPLLLLCFLFTFLLFLLLEKPPVLCTC